MLRKGVTLLEIVTIIVIAGILVASLFFILRPFGNKLRLSGAALKLKQDLSFARQRALETGSDCAVEFFPDSNPQYWRIMRSESGTLWVEEGRTELPRQIRFGVGKDVSASLGLGAIPSDGISFPGNRVVFGPRSGASSAGTVYFTDGDKTVAVNVNTVGTAIVRKFQNGGWE